jgi:uncharacterized protein (DUF2267 family)
MRYDEFVERVRVRARINKDRDAAMAITATLRTLAERIGQEEAEHVASQLPTPLKDLFAPPLSMRDYPLDEFYHRVAARADTGLGEAIKRAGVVMQVLRESISRSEMNHIFDKLPVEYDELLHV